MTIEPENLEAQFVADGFVVVPVVGLIDRLHVALPAFERLMSNAEKLGRNGQVKVRKSDLVGTAGTGWSWGCDHIYSPELREQDLLDLVSLEPIPQLIRRILGQRVRFSGGHGHWSPVSYDYYLHWHRDTRRERWHLGNPDPRAHVQVCIALADEAVVRVVPGSHLRNLEAWEHRFIGADPHGKHPAQVIVGVPAGCALLLNTYTFHRAQCEKEAPRRSLHYGLTRVGSVPEPGRQEKTFQWIGEPHFLLEQSTFLQQCIEEQLNNSTLKHATDAAE